MNITTDFNDTALFGGAIRCSIPSNFIDTSQIRDVPDHQEVYHEVSINKNQTDSCKMLVFEILEYQNDVADEDAMRYFFEDLSDANGATLESQRKILSSFPIDVPPLMIGSNCSVLACIGTQLVGLGRECKGGVQYVKVELLLVRMKNVGTDFLVSFSIPINADTFNSRSINPKLEGIMGEVLRSLRVIDFSLFG